MQQKIKSNIGSLLVILAGVCWGTISIFIRRLDAAGLSSLRIITYRAWISAIVLFVYLYLKDRKQLRIRIRDIWMFIGTGVLSLTFFSYCYFANIVRSGAAIAVAMLYTSPVFVLLMSFVFFKEKISGRKVIALIMTLLGCMLVSGVFEAVSLGKGMDGYGLLLGLGAGFGYALYSIFAGFALKKGYSSITISFYTFLFSGIALAFLVGPQNVVKSSDMSVLVWIIGVSIICTVIPYIAYTAGMKRVEISKAAVIVTVEPLVGALLGILAYGENTGLAKIIGIVMILASVAILA